MKVGIQMIVHAVYTNKASELANKYVSKKWDDIKKNFTHYDDMSRSVEFEEQMYFILCDRLDICFAVNIIRT